VLTKICRQCKIEKTIDEYHRFAKSHDGHKHFCKICILSYAKIYGQKHRVSIGEKSKTRRALNRERCLVLGRALYRKHIEKVRNYYDSNKIRFMWSGAKKRATARNLEFTINQTDIVLLEKCPVLGIDILYNIRSAPTHNSPTVDRVDNSKGYTPDNIRIISYRANSLKNDANKEEIEKIVSFYQNMAVPNNTLNIDKTCSNKLKNMLSGAKSRAKKRNIEFDINLRDLEKAFVDTCPILGIQLNWGSHRKRSENSPSIERIDPSKGYIKDNVTIISWRANRIKKDASMEELLAVLDKGFTF